MGYDHIPLALWPSLHAANRYGGHGDDPKPNQTLSCQTSNKLITVVILDSGDSGVGSPLTYKAPCNMNLLSDKYYYYVTM